MKSATAADFDAATAVLTKSSRILEQAAATLVEAMGLDYVPRLCAEAQQEVDKAHEVATKWPAKFTKPARHAKALLSSLKFQANSAVARAQKTQALYEETNQKTQLAIMSCQQKMAHWEQEKQAQLEAERAELARKREEERIRNEERIRLEERKRWDAREKEEERIRAKIASDNQQKAGE